MESVQARGVIGRRRAHSIGLAMLAAALLSASIAKAADDEPRGIFIMQRDGTNVHSVVGMKDFKWLGNPRWSHDGKQLAFDAKDSGKPRLFIVGADGKNLLDLGEGAMPCWSPDDKQLAFHVFAGTSPAAETAVVWVQNVDGKARGPLVEGLAPRWSPDGSQIALGGASLRIFDMIESKPRDLLASREKMGPTAGFDWSPDGKRLAAIIERESGRELVIVSAEGSDKQMTTRLRGKLHAVAWSPRENLLAASIQDEKTARQQLYLLSPEGDGAPELIAGQEGDNREPAWSPDGKQLAFASSRKTTVTPAVASSRPGAKLELVRKHDPGGEVFNLAFAPDGRTALLGGGLLNHRLQLWDTAADTTRNIEIWAWSVAMSPDGRHGACAPATTKKEVQYLDLEDGSVVREMVHGAMVIALQFSHDGAKIATTGEDNAACIFDVESGEQLFRWPHPNQIASVQWSRDNKLVGVTCVDKKLRLFDVGTGKKVREIEHTMAPYTLSFAPDGVHVVTGTGGDPVSNVMHLNYTPAEDNPICVWDIASGKLVRELKGHEYAVFGVEYSPDGKYIASASFDGSVRLWDAELGVELDRVTGAGFVTKAIFSPDGSQLLVSGGVRRGFNAEETTFDSSYWSGVPNERLRLFKIVPSLAASGTKD